MEADLTPGEPPAAGPELRSTSLWLVVPLVLSFLGLLALVALTLAPTGGCGGG
jgi:hypothetical protein